MKRAWCDCCAPEITVEDIQAWKIRELKGLSRDLTGWAEVCLPCYERIAEVINREHEIAQSSVREALLGLQKKRTL